VQRFDPFDPDDYLEPFTRLSKVRRECPVVRLDSGFAFVARDDDARSVLRDWPSYSSEGNFELDEDDDDPPLVTQVDPPDHPPLRRVLLGGLNPAAIADLESFLRITVHQLLDEVQANRACDLMTALAVPLPARAIARLVGVAQEHTSAFIKWNSEITSIAPAPFKHLDSWTLMQDLIRDMTRERRSAAQRPDDLVSRLIEADFGGKRLNDDEIRMAIFQLMIAGIDSTSYMIGNAVYQLLSAVGQWERIQEDLGLIPAVIEESLRVDTPITWVMRRCTAEKRIGGQHLDKGARVLVGLASANRDEQRWPHSDRFDLDRADSVDHLAFGHGIHLCLGAALARAEGRVALEALSTRMPTLKLAEGSQYEPVRKPMFRGPTRLDVVW
jgi:cytochrome P450 family 142 subfamily A polypeptide 1